MSKVETQQSFKNKFLKRKYLGLKHSAGFKRRIMLLDNQIGKSIDNYLPQIRSRSTKKMKPVLLHSHKKINNHKTFDHSDRDETFYKNLGNSVSKRVKLSMNVPVVYKSP